MKWLIKNPAPLDERLEKWGDYHFGRCLAKWLTRLGEEVDSDYHGEWDSGKAADVFLVIRGRRPCRIGEKGFRVMWIISHPGSVSAKECASYDLVFTASERHAQWLKTRLDRPVYPLLQCVDAEEFSPPEAPGDTAREGFVFVGNTRGEMRRSVLWAIDAGLQLRIWGRQWEGWVDRRFVAGDYFENQRLGGLYAGARATFNDHWPDMRKWGFVNNRIFDALACGLPVISDHHQALEDLFGDAVLIYRNRGEFYDCIERLLLGYPAIRDRARQAADRVRREHSFEARAGRLLETVRRTGS